MTNYLTPDNTEGMEPVPESGLINGVNVFACSGSTNSSIPCTGGTRANFTFTPGKRYRLRLINTGYCTSAGAACCLASWLLIFISYQLIYRAFAEFDFSIDGHNMTVIEADGVDMQPVVIDRLPIHVAQRYSVIVEANQPVGNYWARAVMNQNCFAYTNPALDPNVLASIHYEGAPTIQPNTIDPSLSDPVDCNDLNPSDLRPVDAMDAPDYNVSYYVAASFQAITSDRIRRGYMNQTSWIALQNATTLQQANAGVTTFDSSQFVLTPPNNATVVQLIIQSG
jgi:FtsP/CotA-like multicopper oxidase with cupredoxin domain